MNKYNVIIAQGSHNNILVPNVEANTEEEAIEFVDSFTKVF